MLGILILVMLILGFYTYMVWDNDYWSKRNVPHDKPLFFFGSLKNVLMGKKHFGIFFQDLYNKFPNAAYVGYFNTRTPSIMVRDPELIRNILVKDFASFANNDIEADEKVDPLLRENIFVQTGEEWKKNRAAWTAGLTMNKIKTTYDMMSIKSEKMIEHIERRLKENPNEAFDVKDLSSTFFTEVVVNSIFGLKSDQFNSKDPRFVKIANAIFAPSFWTGIKMLMYFVAPKIVKIFRLRFVPLDIHKDLINISREVLEVKKVTDYHKNNSFDSILCNENRKINEITVAGLIFNFLVDGTETSAGVAAFLLYSLAANPHIQHRLREEVESVVDEEGKISFESINKLQYMDMVFSETLRLYTPALSLQKTCTKPYILPPAYPGGDNVRIEVGTSVVVPIYGLHMDPEYFLEPEKFDPERFSEENKNNIQKFTYLPFGEGPRVCIGSRFGANQVKIEVASLIRNFELRLAPELRGKPIVIDPNIIIYRPAEKLLITFHKLKK